MPRSALPSLALAALSAIACAQGSWPDDPWTDFRTIQSTELSRDGRAVAYVGTTIVASGYAPVYTDGAFATFVPGARGYVPDQLFLDPALTPTPGFGMRLAGGPNVIAVADPGYSLGHEHVTLGFNGPKPKGPARVEIYTRPNSSSPFSHSQTLENPTGDDRSGFGLALSFAGDYLLVGAPFTTVFGVPEVGAAFLYENRTNQNEYRRIATFIPPSIEPYGQFGWSVAATDYSGMFIGWPNFDDGTGRALHYDGPPSGPWKITRAFTPAEFSIPDDVRVYQFGASVAIMPDDDGILAIGAPSSMEQITDRPMVFIYESDFFVGQPFEPSAIIEPPAAFAGQRFGDTLAIDNDRNDYILAVGSGNRDIGGGVVDVYRDPIGPDGWSHTAQLRNVNAGSLAMQPHSGAGRILASGNNGQSAIQYSRSAVCFPDLRADANNDGVTNFEDLNLILSQYGQEGDDLEGDLNNDGVVDFFDLNVVLVLFGSPCIPPN